MLFSINRIIGAPIMSLQTGQPLGRLATPIIDPYTLRIVAFYVEGPRLDFSPAVLFTDDIREFGRLGAIVDSVDNIMSTDGLVRLNEIISYNFTLNRILVVDDNKRKLGKVSGYVIDPLNFEIRQLQVRPSVFRSLSTAELLVNRSQIIKVEPDKITVKTPTVQQSAREATTTGDSRRILNPEFDNPFRKKPVTNNQDRAV